MPNIFSAETTQGYSIKLLSEILNNNLTSGFFLITKKGMFCTMMDKDQPTVLINLELNAEGFKTFFLKKELHIGINLDHFHKMLKNLKKKDSIELFIDEKNETDLGIRTISKENKKVTTSTIKIHFSQNIEVDIPEGYEKSVKIQSSDFQSMCKSLSQLSKTISVSAIDDLVRFSADKQCMKTDIDFGSSKDKDIEEFEYTDKFNTEQFTKISKITGLDTYIQIFFRENSPLLIKSFIANLGKISIYLKSISMQERDSASSRPAEDEE
jgi:proliferating cell nuclear antigen PCNA